MNRKYQLDVIDGSSGVKHHYQPGAPNASEAIRRVMVMHANHGLTSFQNGTRVVQLTEMDVDWPEHKWNCAGASGGWREDCDCSGPPMEGVT